MKTLKRLTCWLLGCRPSLELSRRDDGTVDEAVRCTRCGRDWSDDEPATETDTDGASVLGAGVGQFVNWVCRLIGELLA